ncbi:hypothetical protein D3C80_1653630 [compost metagenome]
MAEGQPQHGQRRHPHEQGKRQLQVEGQHRNGNQRRPVEGGRQGPGRQAPEQGQGTEVDTGHRHLVDGYIDRVPVALAVVAEPVVESLHGTSLVLRLKPARLFPASRWSGTNALVAANAWLRYCPCLGGIVPTNRAPESRRYCPCLGG